MHMRYMYHNVPQTMIIFFLYSLDYESVILLSLCTNIKGYSPEMTLVEHSVVPEHLSLRPQPPLPKHRIHNNGQTYTRLITQLFIHGEKN